MPRTKYDSKIIPGIAQKLYISGFDDDEVAEKLGISGSTISVWANKYPEFKVAREEGKAHINFKVVDKLKQLTQGIEYEEKVLKPKLLPLPPGGKRGRGRPPKQEYEVVSITKKWLAPNVGAMQFFLKNRMPDQFSDRQDINLNGNLNTTNTVVEMTPEQRKKWLEDHGFVKKE